MAWPQWVTIKFLYREGEGGLVAEVCHDTIICIMTEGRIGVAGAMIPHSSALRHGVGALRHAR